ncbi:MAG TPA: hypothetical protein VH331_06515 [Allosphingosinicella sp.]|nr:hypothetical protein [Allosphingosinicella sp.]
MAGFLLLSLLATSPVASPPPAEANETAMMKADDEAVRRGFTKVRHTIPVAFQGAFRRTLEECAAETDSALVVRPTRIVTATGEGDVQSVKVEAPRKIVVDSIYDGHGQVWEQTDTILLGRDGDRIAFQSASGPDTRLRCPAHPAAAGAEAPKAAPTPPKT